MWNTVVEPDRPQMIIPRMRITYWITKATNTHSEYVILITFPSNDGCTKALSILRYTYIACLVYRYMENCRCVDVFVWNYFKKF